MVKRRNFKREFKLEILRQLDTKPVAEIAKEHNLHPMVIYKWRSEFERHQGRAFHGHGRIRKLEAELAQSQRLVGSLYAQVDFLKKASEMLKARLAEERIKRS